MIVDVDPAARSVSLLEPDVFTAFSARSTSTDASVVGPAMGAAGFAADEPDHVWVSIDWLVGAAAGDASWREGFDGMLAYATSKGWTNPEGTHIKAHIEPARS